MFRSDNKFFSVKTVARKLMIRWQILGQAKGGY